MTSDILTRLREATGPSREMDIAIGKAFPPSRIDSDGSWFEKDDLVRYPLFTSSVDASLALVERMLPGWGGLIGIGTGTSIHTADLWSEARAHQNSEEEEENPLVGEDAHGEHRCLPIAVLIALFTALQEKENTNGN